MEKPISIALVAVGGYGKFYVNALLDKTDPATYRIVGIVDPFADRCARLDELKARNIPIYDTLAEFYKRHKAELVTIASPIQFHCEQVCEVLVHGGSALCEKPAAPTIQEVRRMMEARDKARRKEGLKTSGKARRFVAIGYQWSFSEPIQELKRDIRSGLLGKPIRLKTIALWPRAKEYYSRNNWAGAMDNGKGGWILDSPVNNATAHYLHNMFYVLGHLTNLSARPDRVVAELYRANPIANYDTAAARIVTGTGVELLYYATHAVNERLGPDFVYEFENATVRYSDASRGIEARFRDGSRKSYGDPNKNGENKLRDAMSAVRGHKAIVCGPEAASSHALCVNAMQESMPAIAEFPRGLVRVEGKGGKALTFVEGLNDVLKKCYKQNKLPSEIGAPWAVAGKEVSLRGYKHFPGKDYAGE